MKKGNTNLNSANEKTILYIVENYRYSIETARILVETNGNIDAPTYLRLLQSDKTFEADQTGRLLFSDPQFAAKLLAKENIDWEKEQKNIWESIQQKLKT